VGAHDLRFREWAMFVSVLQASAAAGVDPGPDGPGWEPWCAVGARKNAELCATSAAESLGDHIKSIQCPLIILITDAWRRGL